MYSKVAGNIDGSLDGGNGTFALLGLRAASSFMFASYLVHQQSTPGRAINSSVIPVTKTDAAVGLGRGACKKVNQPPYLVTPWSVICEDLTLHSSTAVPAV